MNERIKTSQLMMLIITFVMGSTLLITLVDGISAQGTWVVMVAAFVLSVPFLLVYISLAKRFPGKSLIEINDIIFGRVAGKAISIIYLLFFFLLLTFNTADLSSFYTGYIIPEAPQMAFIVPVLLVCAFTVKRGLSALVRVSVVTTIFTVATVVLMTLLLIGNMDFSNFLPVFDKPAIKYIQATQTVAELPILELVAMLMVTPMLRDNKKLTRWWMGGVGVAMIMFVTIAARDTAVLGAASNILGENSYEAIRLVNIGEFLTRIELLIAITYTALLFVKTALLYYVTATALSQLLRVDRNVMILPLGALTVFFAAIKVESTVEHTIWGARYAAVFSFPCVIVFPLLMVIIAAIRKLKTQPPEADMLREQDPQKRRPKRQGTCAPPQKAN